MQCDFYPADWWEGERERRGRGDSKVRKQLNSAIAPKCSKFEAQFHNRERLRVSRGREVQNTLKVSSGSRDASARTASKRPSFGSSWQNTPSGMWKKGWEKNRMGIYLDEYHGEYCHFCCILWADSYWVMSHSKEHVKHMIKD